MLIARPAHRCGEEAGENYPAGLIAVFREEALPPW